jgi:micrococcal nuclease
MNSRLDDFVRAFTVRRVVDADTLVADDVDLGYHTHVRGIEYRLLGVDAPEMRGSTRPAGVVATDYTRAWLDEHGKHGGLFARSIKTDSFGRYLAVVRCGEGHSLGDALLASGNAVPYP